MACSCEKSKPGRFVSSAETSIGEPLLAIAENTISVACCGPCEPGQHGGVPTNLRFEKVTRGESGLEFSSMQEVELPKKLVKEYEASLVTNRHHKHGGCLPWVRVQRDPRRFSACMAAAKSIGPIDDAQKVYELIRDHMAVEDQEVFYVIMLDTQLYVRGVGEIARGARDRVEIPIPDTLRLPLVEGATAFIVAHNHPSGKSRPSEADKHLTAALEEAGAIIKIPLADHVIVGDGEFFSFRDHKLLKN